MKGIGTLIKLSKRSLDELRRKLANLETQKAQLLELTKKLQDELAAEIVLASKQVEMAGFFGDFAKRMKRRQEEVAAEIRELDKQMEKLNEEIGIAFSELKKYEIAQENSKKRAIAKENHKQNLLLDDIASQQHRRKSEEA